GWAVAPAGMQQVELSVDGQLASTVPLGGRRADVGAAYPSYPGAAQSGFAMAFNYSELAAGAHTFTVRAIDKTGGGRSASATVKVIRFDQAFMADPAVVNVNTAKLTRSGRTIAIQNIIAAGRSYDVSLDWQPAAQGFALTRIADSQGVPAECVYSLRPIDQIIPVEQADKTYTGSVNVTTPVGCSWTAQSNHDWIAITSGTSGAGPGTVQYSVSSNPSDSNIRTGGLTIAGHLFAIYQWNRPPQPGGGGK
ncbi:MAG: BACON domain-containing carbohydrate-binding protein, partial [Candidatus Contendobacter sp.]